MKKCLVILFIFKSFLVFSQSQFLIDGFVVGASDKSSAELISFDYGELTVVKSNISKGKVLIDLNDKIADGIYKIKINYVGENSNMYQVFHFYLIVDKAEKQFKFEFEPTKNLFPNVLISNINKNWYDFLKLENFRIATIDYVKNAMDSKNSSLLSPPKSFDDILNKEIKELRDLRLNYLSSNYNKWSTLFVKNTFNQLYFDKVSKDDYWKNFDISNTDLMNTPVFHDLIQNYILLYYKNADESGYKQGFDEVIRVFDSNLAIKEWVIKYVVTGVTYLNNKELLSYFSNKYKYKVF